MQDWLTVIGVLLIVGILLDGVRRMRNAKRDNIRVSRNVKRKAAPELSGQEPRDPYTSELPNGGARVVAEDALQSTNEKPSVRAAVKKRAPRKQPTIPQQVTLNLDESVPMLMESVDEKANEDIDEELSDAEVPLSASMEDRIEPSFDHGFSADESASLSVPASLSEPSMEVGFESNEFDVDGSESEYDTEEMAEPEEVIIINVMMVNKQYFQGEALLDVLLQSGMRYGDMNIFHRYTDTNGNGSILFSLANMVKPGDFNLDSMGEFQTPGVSLFMTLPIKADSLKAFDTMRQTAEAIANALNGELKDEDRNRMTHQTMEHCRQRIQDYERKRLSRVGT